MRGGKTLANPSDRSTLFYYHQNQNRSGWNNSCLALFRNDHSARNMGTVVDIHSEGSRGFINDVEVTGDYAGFRVGIRIRGDHTVRKNYFDMDMQPEDGMTQHMILIDNPTAQRNLFEGCAWDPGKSSGAMVEIRRATGENVVIDRTGHGDEIMNDHTNDSSNTVRNPY